MDDPRSLRGWLWPLIAAVGGLSVAALGAVWLHRQVQANAQREFSRLIERAAHEIVDRFNRPIYGLNGARGLHAGMGGLDRTAFRAYVASRDLDAEFPGVRGLGLIEVLERERLEDFLAEARADGAPQFTLRQLEDRHHADLMVIRYIEPPLRNQGAMGLDVGSEPRRRQGAEQALRTGKPALTPVVQLVQDKSRSPGVLLFQPFESAKGRALLYAPVVLAELLADLPEVRDGHLRLTLTDGTPAQPLDRMFEAGLAAEEPRYSLQRTLNLPGRQATLRAESSAQFEAAHRSWAPLLFFLATASASLALGGLLRQQTTGRQQAEALARTMTADLQRLALVARRTTNGVHLTDHELRIVWINEGFERLTGFGTEQAIGRTPRELLQTDAERAEMERLNEALRLGRSYAGELRIRHRDGQTLWVAVDVQAVHDDTGRLTGFITVQNDINARKLAERELERERRSLANIIDGTHAGTWEWNVQTGEVRFNARWAGMLGYRLEELEPLSVGTWLRLTHPDDVGPTQARLREHFDGRTPIYESEMRMRHRDGHWVWILTRGKLFSRAEDGAPRWMAGTHQDISDRHLAEAEAKRANDLLRHAIDALDEAFVLYGPDDRMVLCNERYRLTYPAVAELMQPGVSFETLIRTGAERGEYAQAVGRVDEWVAERVALHQAANSTVAQPLADGRWLRIVERRLPDGHIVGFRIDITELMRATEAAQAASQAKSQFVANMSHEIRTPMNAVLGLLTLLKHTELSARQRDYADKAEAAARSLLSLLNDILDFSKVEAGKLELEQQPFDLGLLLEELAVLLSAQQGSKPVALVFDIDPALPLQLQGDAMRLRQVLINLCSNALKFTAAGEVVLRLRRVSQADGRSVVRFEVSDTGVGIAPEHQARIFSGFTQAEASTTRRFGGTGLGLAISQRLVGLMGGSLSLQSALGEGSCFAFELPLGSVLDEALPAPTPALSLGHKLCSARQVQALEAAALRQGWTLKSEMPVQVWVLDAAADEPAALAQAEALRAQGFDGPLVLLLQGVQRQGLESRWPAHLAPWVPLLAPFTPRQLGQALAGQAADASSAAAALPGQGQLSGVRLLLVEDNPVNQQVALELLRLEGAEVELAVQGLQAVEILRERPQAFDAVLMDVQMPIMDGYTATRAIRTELGLHALPILAMTANALPADREACRAAGMDAHIGKPFAMAEVVAGLRQHLGPREWGAATPQALPEWPAELVQRGQALGLDLRLSMARFMGRPALFLAACQGLQQAAQGVAELLRSAPLAEQAQQLHGLKGLAATVGLPALTELALEAEQAAKAGRAVPERCAQALQRLCERLVPDVLALAEALRPADEVPAPLDREGLPELLALLQAADMQALQAHAEWRARQPIAAEPQLRRLDEAMAALDFAAAAAAAEALAAG
ncbi:PAS domain S-box-containing protein [Inhella inkyongensis]|uniref:Sensory/regulatory protein RpfC n=1 Tax=Inhella inkyongensis TaxID=392593 RepID=A0A840S6U0_9BURK|nr:CHASE domain-containing protein [Inhella inkyongensis]MBB5205228.1 PAS domain S-box-containing protein [Inhella inkyongensis]